MMRFPLAVAIPALMASSLLAVRLAHAASTEPERFRIISRFEIGGNDVAYDYLHVDTAAQRLYVAHGNRVDVLGLPGGARVGELTGMHGVHGTEIIPQLGKGYTSDGLDRAVTVFDRETLRTLRTIAPTGIKPDAIQYDPQSARLYVVNGGESGNVTVIDPKSDAIVATVELAGGKLEQIGFDGRGRAFVNDEGKSIVHVFDTATLKKVGEWKLGTCEEPTGMAVDAPHHRLHSVCGNHVMAVLDTDDGRLVAEVAIGADPDGVALDARRSLLFVSNREGTLDVIRQGTPDSYARIQVVKTGPGARTVALDPASGRVYVPTVQFGKAPPGGGRPPIMPSTFAVLVVGEAAASAASPGQMK